MGEKWETLTPHSFRKDLISLTKMLLKVGEEVSSITIFLIEIFRICLEKLGKFPVSAFRFAFKDFIFIYMCVFV